MYYKNIDLREKEEIEIVCLSDWHLGSKNFEDKKAKQFIDYVCENDNVFVVGVGDLTNTALKNSKSDVYTSMNPKEEIELLCGEKFLGKIPKEKWLLFTSGNHGNRMTRETSISVDELIVNNLGIKDKYSQFLGVINVQLKNSSFYIGIHHGTGGGSTLGGKANRLQKFNDIICGCDVILMGHTHTPMHIPISNHIIDKKHNKVQEQKTHLVNVGSLHNFDDSYAEEKLLKPSLLGQAIITLSAIAKHRKKLICRWEI
jgi:predicted phosphodiesterase